MNGSLTHGYFSPPSEESMKHLYHDGRWTNSELYDTFWVDKTKPLQSGFVGPMKLLINFLCQLRVDPGFVEHEHMYVTSLANSQSRASVKGFAKG